MTTEIIHPKLNLSAGEQPPHENSGVKDTKQIRSKRRQFKRWLHQLGDHSTSPEPTPDETVFIDIEDAFLNSSNPLSYVPILSAIEAEHLNRETGVSNHPHGKKLKAFLREHLKRKPSKFKKAGKSHKVEQDRSLCSSASGKENTVGSSTTTDLAGRPHPQFAQIFDENDISSKAASANARLSSLKVKDDMEKSVTSIVDPLLQNDYKQGSLKRASELEIPGAFTEPKRTCLDKSSGYADDDEFIDESSSVYSDIPSPDTSMCKTPPAMLTNEAVGSSSSASDADTSSFLPLEDKIYVAVEKLKAAVHRQSSGSLRSGFGGSTTSPFKKNDTDKYEPTRIRVPTFRQSLRKMHARGLLEDVKNGTIKEEDLLKLARKENDRLDFRDARFFEKEAETSDSSKSLKSQEEDSQFYSVKFDKFSHLLMYDTGKEFFEKRSKSLRKARSTGAKKIAMNTARSLSDGAADGKMSLCSRKSILKSRSNDRAQVESLRAEDCDKVDVFAFLRFFEHHEAQRRIEEVSLSKIREQQLNNYYANDHVYNSFKHGDSKRAMLDFNRSKKATEINIGRQLQDQKRRIASCPPTGQWEKTGKLSLTPQSCC